MSPIVDQPEVFELSPGERQSALWAKLLAHFNEQLRIKRANNDGDLDPLATAKVRGQIGVYKALIELDTPRPVFE